MLAEPWNQPFTLTRTFCIFEEYATLEGNAEFEVVLPPAEQSAFMQMLCEPADENDKEFSSLWKAFDRVDVEASQSSDSAIRESILSLVAERIGNTKFNLLVTTKLKEAFTHAAEEDANLQIKCVLDIHTSSSHVEHLRTAKIADRVVEMLRKVGMLEQAKAMISRGIQVLANIDFLDSEIGADLEMHMGQICYRSKPPDTAGGVAHLEVALDRRSKSHTLDNTEGANLLRLIGSAKRELGDLDGAMVAYMNAKDVYESLGKLHTVDMAKLLNSMGQVHCRLRNEEAALEAYESAKHVRVKADLLRTPDGAKLVANIAQLYEKRGDAGRAVALYDEGIDLLINLSLQESTQGQAVINKRVRCIDAAVHDANSQIDCILDPSTSSSSAESRKIAEVADSVGEMLTKTGMLEEATAMLSRGIQVLASVASLDSETGANLEMRLGQICYRSEPPDVTRGLEHFKVARARRSKSNTLDNKEGAKLLRLIGYAHQSVDDHDGASEAFAKARDIYEAMGQSNTNETAKLINKVGVVQLLLGNEA